MGFRIGPYRYRSKEVLIVIMPTYCLDLTIHNTPFRLRGIGRYAYFLAKALSELRDALEPGERLMAAMRSGTKTFITNNLCPDDWDDPLPPEKDTGRANSIYHKKHREEILRAVSTHPVDVFHFSYGTLSFPGPFSSVVTCHDLIPLRFPRLYLRGFRSEVKRRLHDYLAYHRANQIIAISQATRRDLADILGIPQDKCRVVYQGVDHGAFGPEPVPGEGERLLTKYHVPSRYVLYVGEHDPRKRVDLLIRACNSVYRTTGIPLVLAGKGRSPEDLDGRTRAAYLGADPGAVRLLGRVSAEDLPALYRRADVHALPSVYEGFGFPVVEAMACGCPVVTTRASSLPEVAGHAAYYVAQDSLSELESALCELLRRPELRDRYRRAGLEQARQFTWKRSAASTLEAYREAAGFRTNNSRALPSVVRSRV